MGQDKIREAYKLAEEAAGLWHVSVTPPDYIGDKMCIYFEDGPLRGKQFQVYPEDWEG